MAFALDLFVILVHLSLTFDMEFFSSPDSYWGNSWNKWSPHWFTALILPRHVSTSSSNSCAKKRKVSIPTLSWWTYRKLLLPTYLLPFEFASFLTFIIEEKSERGKRVSRGHEGLYPRLLYWIWIIVTHALNKGENKTKHTRTTHYALRK